MNSPLLILERFCRHHDRSSFNCGKPEFNNALESYAMRFAAGCRDIVFVVVDSANAVRGYITFQELVFQRLRDRSRFLYIPHLAVDKFDQGRDTARNLVAQAYRVYDLLQTDAIGEGSDPYFGVVIHSHGEPRIEALLRELGFRQMPSNRLCGGREIQDEYSTRAV